MCKQYIVAKPFGPYSKGDKVQFSQADAERFKMFLVQPENKTEENKKTPPAGKK